MPKMLRVYVISCAIALTTLVAMQVWQRSSAQTPLERDTDQGAEPKLIVVQPLGYKPTPKSNESEEGRQLFEQFNCMACHSIHNVGGDLAPRLDGVGGRRTEQFLIAHLSNSLDALESYKHIRGIDLANSLPHSRYSPVNAKLLVSYLYTLPEPPGGFIVMPHVPRLPAERSQIQNKEFKPIAHSAATEAGAKLYDRFGCVACHAIGEFGGWLGPRLDGIGARRDRSYILAHVTDAQAHAQEQINSQTKSRMPRFHLGRQECEEITDYLLSLPEAK